MAGNLDVIWHPLEVATSGKNGPPKKYVGVIWIGDDPGIRVELFASSAEEAGEVLKAEYGDGHAYTLRNEEDADRPR